MRFNKNTYQDFVNHHTGASRESRFGPIKLNIKLYLANTPEGDTPRKIKAQQALAQWERKLK